MQINNTIGDNRKLSDLCKFFGTSDISKMLDNFDEDQFCSFVDKYTSGNCYTEISGMPYASESEAVWLVEGDRFNKDIYKDERTCIAYLSMFEDGPNYEMPLHYLQTMIERELYDRCCEQLRSKN